MGKEVGRGRDGGEKPKKRTQRGEGFYILSTHTHMERVMMGVCHHAGELLFLRAVKVFTGQQNLIDRHTPLLYKDSS